jgi:hypothetical protein
MLIGFVSLCVCIQTAYMGLHIYIATTPRDRLGTELSHRRA